MEKMRETDIRLASANQEKPPLSSSTIDQRLHESFPLGLPVPSHHTYASMVLKAIRELGEEYGSSESSISEYIKANYDYLPRIHDSILTNHLNRLCDEGVIELVSSNLYSIPGFTLKPGVHPHGSSCGNQEPQLIRYTYKKLRHGKRRLFLQEKREVFGLDSRDGLVKDEHVKNGCENLVVIEDKESRLNTEVSIPDIVKFRGRNLKRKCYQDQDRDTDDESSEHDSSFERLVKKKKKVVYKQTDRVIVSALGTKLPNQTTPKGLVTSKLIISLEDDTDSSVDDCMNNAVSSEKLVKRKKVKEVADKQTDHVIVFALATKLPNSLEPKRRRRLVSPFPTSELQKHDNQAKASILSRQETKSNCRSWIQRLLQTDFYGQCKIHADVEKSICDLYCTNCKNVALCASCVTSHEGHHVIRINQTDYEVSVDVSDIENHVDISGIQTLKTSATNTTIVLKRTVPSWFCKPSNNVCLFCKRRVPYPFKFCALSCKLQHRA